jgi:hypothetical protein
MGCTIVVFVGKMMRQAGRVGTRCLCPRGIMD